MFIDSTNYKLHVEAIIEESDDLKIAVAFWGKGSEELLNSVSKKFDVICNLTSGGTNPKVVKAIIKLAPRVNIRYHDDLHAKVLIGKKSIIVGSANMSTNGLNIESDEFSGWQEAGYLTDQVDAVEAAAAWFHTRWLESKEITEATLKLADVAWKNRSATRILHPKSSSKLFDLTPCEANGRRIFVVFYDEEPSSAAEKIDAEKRKNEPEVFSELSYFEDGQAMRKGDRVISIRIKNNSLTVDGTYLVVPVTVKRKNVFLQYVSEVSSIDDFSWTKKEARIFCNRLLSILPKIRKLNSWYAPYASVLKMLEKNIHRNI